MSKVAVSMLACYVMVLACCTSRVTNRMCHDIGSVTHGMMSRDIMSVTPYVF